MPCDPRELAVPIVCYNGRPFLPECLATLFASPDVPPPQQVVVVENGSTDDSLAWIRNAATGVAAGGRSLPGGNIHPAGGVTVFPDIAEGRGARGILSDLARQCSPPPSLPQGGGVGSFSSPLGEVGRGCGTLPGNVGTPGMEPRPITVVPSATNLGFAGGNNLGFREIRSRFPHVRYVALLNQDTCVAPGWLAALARVLDDAPDAAAAQAKLMLHPEITRLNSGGNWSHFLGFGFVSGFDELDTGQFDRIRELDFPSGAAMMVRVADIPADEDLFDPTFGSYLEDAELGWRLRLRGRRILFAPGSVVYHKYTFAQNPGFYENLERNRWFLLLACYRLRTLLVLLPAIILMEGGLLLFFAAKGMLGAKLRAMSSILDPKWRSHLAARRRSIQSSRTISDRKLIARFGSRIDFPRIRNPLLDIVGNPLLDVYWSLTRRIIFW